MKFIIIIIFVFCNVITVFGQSDTIKKNDSIPKIRKNEIGIGLSPILNALIGVNLHHPNFNLTYKRINGKWAFRSNLTFGERNYGANDFEKHRNHNGNYSTGRIGCEYRGKSKRFRWYYVTGIDLQFSNEKSFYSITEDTLKIISIQNAGTAKQSYKTSRLNTNQAPPNYLLDERTLLNQYGLGITFGVNIPVKKCWWVLLQSRANFYYLTGITKSKDNVAMTNETRNNSVYSFDTDQILSEISLFYRF